MKALTSPLVAIALTAMLNLPTAAAEETTAASTTSERIVKIKVVRLSAGTKTETNTQVVFQPGKRAKLRIGGSKSDDTTNSIEIVVNPLEKQPRQHLIEVKIIEEIGDQEPSILAAPKLLTHEGRRASIQIGEENGDGIKIELLVEPVK
ncbi:MAG: hypothetical protein JNL96_08145 [Planctomycetaceae bacterium]|nr:hypothetical protein [Planctomycetaceae bacterium]